MVVGVGVSIEPDPLQAGLAAAGAAGEALEDDSADLAIVFASGTHLAAPEATLEGVHAVLAPSALVGCGAGGVLGEGREHESGTGLVVWAARLRDDERATSFTATAVDTETEPEVESLPPLGECTGAILLCDPYSFPTDVALGQFASEAPGVPVLGGLASARTAEGEAALFFGEEVAEGGAVGVRFEGIEMLPCVSQGAAPVGREVTITAAEGNVIHELAGSPALQTVERLIAEMSPRERALVAGGLLIGLVIDGGKPEYQQGDFLVRGVLGVEPDSGSLAVGAAVEPGQVVRLHARDAASADDDLRMALRLRAEVLAGSRPAGAVVFSCNGRGKGMFGIPDHDARAVQHELRGAPAAGFFAAGEIGPVGGRSFLHGFTATVAIFGGASARVTQ